MILIDRLYQQIYSTKLMHLNLKVIFVYKFITKIRNYCFTLNEINILSKVISEINVHIKYAFI